MRGLNERLPALTIQITSARSWVEHRGLRRFQARTYLNYANVSTCRGRRGFPQRPGSLAGHAFETASNSGGICHFRGLQLCAV